MPSATWWKSSSSAVLVVVLMGCGKEPAAVLLDNWVATDPHVHSSVGSNDTDGLGTRDAIGPAMEAAGLDWVFMSDHSNAAGSMHCADVEDCHNLGPETTDGWPAGVWMASEISPVEALSGQRGPRGHTGCLAPEIDGFADLDHFVDRPVGEVSGGDGIEQCLAAGGWAILNHPYGPAPWVAFDWTSDAFDAMEVYNGGGRFDTWDEQAVAEWERRVADGDSVVAVGGSDCHRWGTPAPGTTLDPALGWPITWVNLDKGETVLDGLRAGRVVVAEPGTTLEIVARTETGAVGPGQHIDGPADLVVKASAVASNMRLEVRTMDGEELASAPIAGKTELTLTVPSGAVYARVWPVEADIGIDRGGVALTNPVWVD